MKCALSWAMIDEPTIIDVMFCVLYLYCLYASQLSQSVLQNFFCAVLLKLSDI